MEKPVLALSEDGDGKFYIEEEKKQIAEMVFRISGNLLTVFHTEVLPEYEGKGLAKQLLETMVEYVRAHGLKVVPLCPYVLLQFKRHPEQYADIWSR